MAVDWGNDHKACNLEKYECLECDKEFIVGAEMIGEIGVQCPYCGFRHVDDTVGTNDEFLKDLDLGCLNLIMKKKVVSIHQPCYIPYLGIFYKIWKSDMFVFLDDAQYSNGYVFDWNRIRTPQGEARLKIPLEQKFGDLLTEVKPKDFLGWREKHLKTIEMNYKRAPYFADVFFGFRECLMAEYGSLAELNMATMELFMDKFGWDIPTFRSSDMKLETRSEARVIEIVKRVGGEIYLSGTGGKNYQTEAHFADAGIKLAYSGFRPLEYRQQWGSFLPNMSVLDYCMNEGFDIDGFFSRVEEVHSGE